LHQHPIATPIIESGAIARYGFSSRDLPTQQKGNSMATPQAATVGRIPTDTRKRRKRERTEQNKKVMEARAKLTDLKKKTIDGKPGEHADALKKARAELAAETKKEARERFVRVASTRTNAALKQITALGEIARSRKYLFVMDDVRTMVSPLKYAVETLEAALLESLKHDLGSPTQADKITFASLPGIN
jgi:hypothetical protein